MKLPRVTKIWLLLLFLGAGLDSVCAQNTPLISSQNKYNIKKRTILEEYEPMMVLTAEERLEMKKEREAVLNYRRLIIDSLQISDKKKRKLLRELYLSPSSTQWNKLSAQILAEDDTGEDD